MAQEKRAVVEATARYVHALVLISEVLNYDFANRPIDESFSEEVPRRPMKGERGLLFPLDIFVKSTLTRGQEDA